MRLKLIGFFILLAAVICWLIMSSCSVTKAKRSLSASVDSVARKTTATVDTSSAGSVTKTDSKSVENFDWYRMTQLINDAKPGDPKVIVVEGGKGSKETQVQQVDSSWFKAAISSFNASVDSLSRRVEQTEKDKKTAPNIWTAVIVLGLLYVVVEAGKWISSKYSITKK